MNDNLVEATQTPLDEEATMENSSDSSMPPPRPILKRQRAYIIQDEEKSEELNDESMYDNYCELSEEIATTLEDIREAWKVYSSATPDKKKDIYTDTKELEVALEQTIDEHIELLEAIKEVLKNCRVVEKINLLIDHN